MAEEKKVQESGCCGGPSPNEEACCVADAEAKVAGQLRCDCSPVPGRESSSTGVTATRCCA